MPYNNKHLFIAYTCVQVDCEYLGCLEPDWLGFKLPAVFKSIQSISSFGDPSKFMMGQEAKVQETEEAMKAYILKKHAHITSTNISISRGKSRG